MHNPGAGRMARRKVEATTHEADLVAYASREPSAFAGMLGGLIEANVIARPDKRKDFESLVARVGIWVTDIEEGVTLVFDAGRKDSMAFSVAERLRDSGARDVPSYLRLLADPAEQQRLLDGVHRTDPGVVAIRLVGEHRRRDRAAGRLELGQDPQLVLEAVGDGVVVHEEAGAQRHAKGRLVQGRELGTLLRTRIGRRSGGDDPWLHEGVAAAPRQAAAATRTQSSCARRTCTILSRSSGAQLA